MENRCNKNFRKDYDLIPVFIHTDGGEISALLTDFSSIKYFPN